MLKLRRKLILSSILFASIFCTQCSVTKRFKSKVKEIKTFEEAYFKVTHFEKSKFLSIKYKAKIYNNNTVNNIAGTIKTIDDSIVYFNIVSRTLGIELFRAICKSDSVFFIDKMNKRYYKGDYSLFSKYAKFNIDYKLLRSLIFAKAEGIAFNYSDSTYNYFGRTKKLDDFIFSYQQKNMKPQTYSTLKYPSVEHSFEINNYGLLMNSYYIDKGKHAKINLAYNYLGNSNIIKDIKTTINDNNEFYKVDIDYINYSYNKVNISFKVPENYTIIK